MTLMLQSGLETPANGLYILLHRLLEIRKQRASSEVQESSIATMLRSLPELKAALKEASLTKTQEYYFLRGCSNYCTLRGNQALGVLNLEPIAQNVAEAAPLMIVGLLAESGNLEIALDYLESHRVKQNSDCLLSEYYCLTKADLHRLMGRYDSARSMYGEISARKGPLYAQMLKGMASTYKVTESFRQGLDCLNELLATFKDSHRYYFSRGHLYHHATQVRGNFSKAASDYKRSLEIKTWHVTHLHLGLAYGHLQKYDHMTDQLVLAVMGFTSDRSWHNDINLGLAYILQDRPAEGLELARNSLAFLGIHEVKCSSANVRSIISDQRFAGRLANSIAPLQAYDSLCQERIAELGGTAGEYRRFLPIQLTNTAFHAVRACVGAISIRGFVAWAISHGGGGPDRLGRFAQEFSALCVGHLRGCTSFIRHSGDGIVFVSRLWSISPTAIQEQVNLLFMALLDLQRDFADRFIESTEMKASFALVFGEVIEAHLDAARSDFAGHRLVVAQEIAKEITPGAAILCSSDVVHRDTSIAFALSDLNFLQCADIESTSLIKIPSIDERIEITQCVARAPL